jgi:hypothetical protein
MQDKIRYTMRTLFRFYQTITAALVLLSGLAAFPTKAQFNYTITNGAVTITQYTGFDTAGGNVVIPSSFNNYPVTSIGDFAFFSCWCLTSLTIPGSVTNIGGYVFASCFSLQNTYFQGNAPSVDGVAGSVDDTVFSGESGTVYYLPGTTGWDTTFGGWPTAMAYQPQPRILDSSYGLGGHGNSFNFTIAWGTNADIVVEASTNLVIWDAVATNTLSSGTNYFSDPQWMNYPQRYYRVRSP